MVQLYLNNQECDLRGDETIAIDYSIAPISNIASRTSAKSITFKLPLTANNREIVENCNVLVNSTTLPYSLVPAKLTANGLSQKIEFAQVKSVKDEIEVSLYGSNIDFYSVIKSLKLSDLGRVWFHAWTLLNAYGSRNNTEGYIYAMIDYFADSPNGFIDNSLEQIDVRGLLPSVYLHSIIDEIITQAGYTAQGDFLTDPDYLSVIIPAFELKDDFVSNETLLFVPDTTSVVPFFIEAGELGLTLKKGGTITIEGAGQRIVLRIRADLQLSGAPTSHRFGMLQVVSATGLTYYDGTNNTTDPATISSLVIGENYRVTYEDVRVINTTPETNIILIFGYVDSTTHIVDGSNLGTAFSSTLQVNRMLPDMKQSDLLKDTAQKFGLIFQVDNINKIVHVRRFSEILDNIDIALDWSGKVDYTEKPEIIFESEYGQRNICTYTEDETVVKPTGTDSEILLDNDNLDAEKELFESPFAASEQVTRFGGYSIAQIKYFTDLGGSEEEIGSPEPRWLVVRFESFSPGFTYTDDAGATTLSAATVPMTHFILDGEAFNAGWENNLLDNSTALVAMVQQYKEANFLLKINAADINQLDFFIPVWIELKGQPGCYFYVSEIKQYKVTSAESTEVALVKLAT